MSPEVSIITVYYNSPEDVRDLRRSMLEHLPKGSYEWIIADNDSAEPIRTDVPEALYLRLDQNYGFGKANNLAAEKASAPFLFFVNPDCLFVENCLPTLLDRMKNVGVAGPRVVNENGTIQLSFGPYLSIFSEYRQQRRMKKEQTPGMQNWIRENAETAAQYVSGCALMISANLFKTIGGFDENFFLYEEDVDLCKRVHDAGRRIAYVPAAVILHKRNKSVQKEQSRASLEYRKSQAYYYRKHLGALQNLLLTIYLQTIARR